MKDTTMRDCSIRMEHLGQNKENNLHRVKTITYGLSVKKGEKRSICCNLRL